MCTVNKSNQGWCHKRIPSTQIQTQVILIMSNNITDTDYVFSYDLEVNSYGKHIIIGGKYGELVWKTKLHVANKISEFLN